MNAVGSPDSRTESVLHRLAGAVVVLALVYAGGCAAAAWNWHSVWAAFAHSGLASSLVAVEAQENWQRWIGSCMTSLLVAVAAMALLVWRSTGRTTSP